MKIISALHHVSIVLMTGGIAGVGLAATVLFQKASSREVAGQIGNVIFGRLAPSVMVLSAVILATAGCAAALVPALRATKVEPASSLRVE